MKKNSKPIVGIIMGSDSDLDVMSQAAQILEKFAVPCEVTIVSAHRTPQRLVDYCQCADQRGLRVLIAGAGGAAHLPGMAAALSPLPVIGVPIRSKNSIEGVDSLLSIAQMPPGVPVATVAINGALNAGILAAQILAASDSALLKKIKKYKLGLAEDVLKKVTKLEDDGYAKYLKRKE
ncbi:MAG: 5-(carboxyamino)imidazole ribonucleotide mutase [Candidatus Omnitrophica bacterium]|nr:5-(carboxyamino)imidazole ribonucleotide mutase [Candidatus Omnitrophota bacterium]